MARTRTSHILLLFCLISFSLATVPSFCKCTCFSQSGIIPLNPPSTKPSSESPSDSDSSSSSSSSNSKTNPNSNSKSARHSLITRVLHSAPLERSLSILSLSLTPRSATRAPTGSSTSASCTKCNRAFCLAQALPFCTDATEADVFTACFQRDSEKDMFIVWGFILATVGLVGWAGVRKVAGMRKEREGGMGVEGGGEYVRVGGL